MLAHDHDSDATSRKFMKRYILGRLVYGMYDRFKRARKYEEWWTEVHYDLWELDKVLTKEELNKYATAVEYEHKNKYFGVFRRNNVFPLAEFPDWVVAIRGTHLLSSTDLKNDLAIVLETLKSSKLIKILKVVVRRLGKDYKYCNVNVTGHSLGAAAGLLVCRRLALKGCLVEGHFFNPPFVALESLARTCAHAVKHARMRVFPADGEKLYERLKNAAWGASSTAFQAVVEPDGKKKAFAEFTTLAEVNWSPYLYVNKHDLICKTFLSHFTVAMHGSIDEDRKMWYSTVTEFSKWFLGKTESFNLLPSAHLVVIETFEERPYRAHKLWNWMVDPQLPYEFKQAKLIPSPHT
ncbi:hypothetical protein MPTK2_3g14600 [Marchantia polymorpha subsp. ruderalis]